MSHRTSTAVGHRMSADSFKKRTVQLVDESTSNLYAIWREAGYEEIECQGLLGDIFLKLKNVCTAELEAEQKILEHAKLQVQSKTAEYSEMCMQLGRPIELPSLLTRPDSNYTDKLAELQRMVGDISVEVSQRSSLLNAEYEKIVAVAASLGETIPTLATFCGPIGTPELSDVRLVLLREFHAAVSKKFEKRREELQAIASKCSSVMGELCLTNATTTTTIDDFVSSILESQYKSYYCFIAETISARGSATSSMDWKLGVKTTDERNLNTLLSQLEAERERRRKELAENGAEIARMWTILRIPSSERDTFTSSFQMNLSMETLLTGRRELQRLREIRTKSLTRVISSIRNDIQLLWSELAIDSVQQQSEEFDTFFEPIESLDDSAVIVTLKNLLYQESSMIVG